MIPALLDCYVDLKALQDATKIIVEKEGYEYSPYENCAVRHILVGEQSVKECRIVDLPHGVLPMKIALKMAEERGLYYCISCDLQYPTGWCLKGELVIEAKPHDHLALLTALVKSYEVKK